MFFMNFSIFADRLAILPILQNDPNVITFETPNAFGMSARKKKVLVFFPSDPVWSL